VHVMRDDRGPLRRAKRWLARRVKGLRSTDIARLGFAEFQVLMAGFRLGLFELLATKPERTIEEIRDHLGIPDHSARALLLSTTSLGYTHRDPRGGYRNSRGVHRSLIGPERAQEIPRLEAFHFLMYQPFYHLTETLQQGTNVGLQRVPGTGNTLYDRLESNAENRRIFYDWMRSLKQKHVASEVVSALRGSRHMLDLGGGDGVNSIDLAQQIPGLKATIVDSADTCALAAQNVRGAALSDRIGVHPGDFLKDPFPAGADAILLAHISNIYSDEMNQALIRKCGEALPRGGQLVIFSLISNDDQTGPWYAGFMSLYFQVLATGVGNVYPPSVYERWFANAGFSSLSMHTKRQGIFIGTK
jgi:L-tyrosine C(3)-methyltransferase